MWFIEKLKINVSLRILMRDIANFGLIYRLYPGRIVIRERELSGATNQPSLTGNIDHHDTINPQVSFVTPVYDRTYPYPGRSKKLIKFLRYLHKKYGGRLKMKKVEN